MTEENKTKKSFPFHFKIVGGILAIVLLAACVIVAIYYYLQFKKTQQLLQNPTLAAELQTKDLLSRVGKLIVLPKDEQPTIATVSDYTKLKNQPFFANAQNGYKVLIYTNAKEAILYDPANNIIVDVAPITIGISPTLIPSPTPKIKKR